MRSTPLSPQSHQPLPTGTPPAILPFSDPTATLQNVGGKGANLARLARAGYPVPDGFLLTTQAYQHFVAANNLAPRILDRVAALVPDQPDSLAAAAADIHAWFAACAMPPDLADAITAAYHTLGQPPVAVRSSATAEDLPDLSFAGQQETYLNVIGEAALLSAVINCWSSLWTARAIAYRARNQIPHSEIVMAVVVQTMVASEASGVLFTANPLSGLRSETVIDATLGLGEALVSGQVEPDRYIVATDTCSIISKRLGNKALTIHGKAEGGTLTRHAAHSQQQALPDAQIIALANLGQRIAAEYQTPQDIEWAWADGQLFVLQARPITSLYPLPTELSDGALRVLASFGAVQGMLDPITPLGQDGLRLIAAGVSKMLGYPTTYDTQPVFRLAGERIWIDISAMVHNDLGRKLVRGALSLAEPSVGRTLVSLWDEPRLAPTRSGIAVGTLARLFTHLLPLLSRVKLYLLAPDTYRKHGSFVTAQYLARLQLRCTVHGDRQTKLAQRIELINELSQVFPRVLPKVATGLTAGMISFNLLRVFAARQHLPDVNAAQLVLALTRGLPHNVTTEMDLRLWAAAQEIRANPDAVAQMQATPAAQLAADYRAKRLNPSLQQVIARFLAAYGRRGLAEIDIGRPRWQEDPTPVMQALQSYLRIDDPNQAPDLVFQRGATAAHEAQTTLVQSVQRTPGGWLKARVVNWLAQRMRTLMGLRESPKFLIIRVMGQLREGLLDSGREYVAAGLLHRADDLFFLHIPELKALAQGEARDWKALIAERRALYEREKRRRQIPRLLLSDGRAFYASLNDAPTSTNTDTIQGDPVSPGVVEGVVRIVFDPHGTQLNPGEILVCPGTDPSWTPLFLAAGGLVTEVGGLMTHGSVVAREYGIPAVVGVERATQRLHTGQRVRIDGSSGQIVLL